PLKGYFWPTNVPAELTLPNLTAVYKLSRYEACQTSDLEVGFEKIAIYADSDGSPTHAARQLPSGAWTSKLGELEDIEHATLSSLESIYGKVKQVLKRPIEE